MTLEHSKIVVVGGSSGIGLGVAEAALARGAEVVIVGHSTEHVRAAEKNLGGAERLSTHVADVRQEEEVQRLFAEMGAFDHLVITRGVPPVSAPVRQFDIQAVRDFVDLMLVSAITLVKHAEGVQRTDGSITFTSGISKDRPGPSGGSLVSAVAGSFTYLARALAVELAPKRVNVVSPGWVETPMWDAIAGPAKTEMWREMASRLPAGRIGTPQDIAPAYLYLMESTFTTGAVIPVDGGHALMY